MTQPYSTGSSTSALSIRILSPRRALDRSYSSRLYFRKLHHVLRIVVDVPPSSVIGNILVLTFIYFAIFGPNLLLVVIPNILYTSYLHEGSNFPGRSFLIKDVLIT